MTIAGLRDIVLRQHNEMQQQQLEMKQKFDEIDRQKWQVLQQHEEVAQQRRDMQLQDQEFLRQQQEIAALRFNSVQCIGPELQLHVAPDLQEQVKAAPKEVRHGSKIPLNLEHAPAMQTERDLQATVQKEVVRPAQRETHLLADEVPAASLDPQPLAPELQRPPSQHMQRPSTAGIDDLL